MQKKKFTPEICERCGQSTEYVISLDKGTAHIILAIAAGIRRKGENKIHLLNEMGVKGPQSAGYPDYETMVYDGKMTFRMTANVPRARIHGLVAFVKEGSGEYLLTAKGAKFLRGYPVQRTAIIDKRTHANKGYRVEDGTVSLRELLAEESHWWATAETLGRQSLFDRVVANDTVSLGI